MKNKFHHQADWLFLLTVSLALLFSSCKEEKQKTMTKSPVRVTAAHPEQGIQFSNLRYVGVIEEKSSTAVSFTGSGLVTQMEVEEGDYVHKGQFIAQLDTTQASNLISNAKAQLNQARDAYNRMKAMYDEGALPEIKWVEVQTQVEQAEVLYQSAVKNKADCTLYAPISGVIGKKSIRTGETALPAQPVCTILDINEVRVKVGIPEKEFACIGNSCHTNIYVDALSRMFEGGKIEKGVSSDLVTHNYDLWISLNNPGHLLLPGMICKVEMLTSPSNSGIHDALYVPSKAIRQDHNGKMFVWVVEKGVAHKQVVALGEDSGNTMAVLDGLSKESLVITDGYQKVCEGTQVEIVSQ